MKKIIPVLILSLFVAVKIYSQPPGTILAYAGTKESLSKLEAIGWAVCDGTLCDRTKPKYQRLFTAIGTSWGGDGGNQFAVPDLRGMFLRGVSDISNADPDAVTREKARPDLNSSGNGGNAVGSKQGDDVKSHSHKYLDAHYAEIQCGNQGLFGNQGASDADNGRCTTEQVTFPAGGSESRPKNVYVYYIIKL